MRIKKIMSSFIIDLKVLTDPSNLVCHANEDTPAVKLVVHPDGSLELVCLDCLSDVLHPTPTHHIWEDNG